MDSLGQFERIPGLQILINTTDNSFSGIPPITATLTRRLGGLKIPSPNSPLLLLGDSLGKFGRHPRDSGGWIRKNVSTHHESENNT